MCKNSCLCWKDLLTPSIAVVIFSVTTSMLQILVQIAVFTGTASVSINDLTGDASTAVKLYMALAAFDFIVVLFGIILLLAVEKNGGHRFSALPWIIWIIPYIIFESAVNIFYFSKAFNSPDGSSLPFTNSRGYLIVPLVYWVVKDILLFIGWWCVVSRLCYWNHTTASAATDSTVLLTKPTAVVGGGPDSFGSVYYNGPSTHVQIRDNPVSGCAHVDVARPTPTSSCQSCGGSNNWGMNGGVYGRDGGVYGQPKYIYNNSNAAIIPTRW